MIVRGRDSSGETRIGRDWPRSVGLVAICVGLVALSSYGIQLEPEGYFDRSFRSASFVLLPVFSGLSLLAIYCLIIPFGPLVRVGSTGMTDLRAGRREIPWTQITNVVRRGQFVQLTLRRTFARTYSRSLTQRLLNRSRKSAGPGHILIADWCLASSTAELMDLIEERRRAHRAAGT